MSRVQILKNAAPAEAPAWDVQVCVKSRRLGSPRSSSRREDRWCPAGECRAKTSVATTRSGDVTLTTGCGVSRMSSLQVPELRLPVDDSDGGGPGGSGGAIRGTVPLLLVPPSNVPRRRHSWICGWVHKSGLRHPDSRVCQRNCTGREIIN